jgi:hypothetical protein
VVNPLVDKLRTGGVDQLTVISRPQHVSVTAREISVEERSSDPVRGLFGMNL